MSLLLACLQALRGALAAGRECKQKTRARGNDVITNVVSANQHFASTFSMQIFKFQRRRFKLSLLLPPAPRRACSQATLLLDPKILFMDWSLLGKTEDLIHSLNALQFLNGPSFVFANQSFGWREFCVLYAEPENISTIRFGWDTRGLRSYLFENPKDPKKQRSPPTGIRSAVPLGGLGKTLIPSLEASSVILV